MTNRPVLERAAPVLGADDISAAINYYRSVLGFAEGWKRGSPPVIAQVGRDDVEVHLTRRVGTATSSVYLYVQGVDAYHAEVKARGGNIVEPIGDRPGGMRDFVVRDPSGNSLAFGELIKKQAGRESS
jgi:predicted enzyme related to lactoylglutathione lyase